MVRSAPGQWEREWQPGAWGSWFPGSAPLIPLILIL